MQNNWVEPAHHKMDPLYTDFDCYFAIRNDGKISIKVCKQTEQGDILGIVEPDGNWAFHHIYEYNGIFVTVSEFVAQTLLPDWNRETIAYGRIKVYLPEWVTQKIEEAKALLKDN